jgi:uroporphyrinogen-III synthase
MRPLPSDGLLGVGVLVTRPEQQAAPLCRLLESAGASALRLPAIEIRSTGDLRDVKLKVGPIGSFDLVIFTSANAVRFGSSLLERRPDLTLAAIGPATARALREAGYEVTVTPAGGFDSESLLSQPALADPPGRRILLVKGMNGRDLLETELLHRGAHVVTAEVYKRELASHSAETLEGLEALFAAGRIQVVTATSVEVAAGLFQIATAALQREFERAHWVVPGARVAAALRGHGVVGPIVQASSAEDQELLAALLRWRRDASGKTSV